MQFKGFPINHLMLNCGIYGPYSDHHPGKNYRKHLERSTLIHRQTLVETNARGERAEVRAPGLWGAFRARPFVSVPST